jgi:stalled ribosome alternative rescue factor ArfA
MAGKGSHQRPAKVPKKQFEANWDKIFGKKPKKNDKK